MNAIGVRIISLRESYKLTQEALASSLGISRASLSHYEKLRREPDFKTIQRIADFFNVSVDYLLGRTSNPKMVLDETVKDFVDNLELSDRNIMEKFSLIIDGRELSEEETKSFIAFVRAQRLMKTN
jgi:transcriptional regulator with XRE-family HTH domain